MLKNMTTQKVKKEYMNIIKLERSTKLTKTETKLLELLKTITKLLLGLTLLMLKGMLILLLIPIAILMSKEIGTSKSMATRLKTLKEHQQKQ